MTNPTGRPKIFEKRIPFNRRYRVGFVAVEIRTMMEGMRPFVASAPTIVELMSVAVSSYLDMRAFEDIAADIATQRRRNKENENNLDRDNIHLQHEAAIYMSDILLPLKESHASNLLMQAAFDHYKSHWIKFKGNPGKQYTRLTELMLVVLNHKPLKLAIDGTDDNPPAFIDRPLTQ